jgi:hypothetical protein
MLLRVRKVGKFVRVPEHHAVKVYKWSGCKPPHVFISALDGDAPRTLLLEKRTPPPPIPITNNNRLLTELLSYNKYKH